MVDVLLTSGADANLLTNYRGTALLNAAGRCLDSSTTMLVEASQNPLARNCYGKTSLDWGSVDAANI